jgi:hypothetical protein
LQSFLAENEQLQEGQKETFYRYMYQVVKDRFSGDTERMSHWLADWKDQIPDEPWVAYLSDNFERLKKQDQEELLLVDRKLKALDQLAQGVGFYEDEDMEI